MTPIKWDKPGIIEKLREYQSQGLNLCNHGEIRRRDPNLVAAARRRFGSYPQCIQSMGIHYQPVVVRSIYKNGDSVVERIRLYQREGKDFSYNKMAQTEQRLVLAGKRYFGSWGAALEAAGIDYEGVSKRHDWTRESVIARLRELEFSGEDLHTTRIMNAPEHARVFRAAKVNFGSYAAALNAAGISLDRLTRATYADADAVRGEIVRLHGQGEGLSYKYIIRVNPALMAAADRCFGDWRTAINAAGINYDEISRRKTWNRGRILKELKRLHQRGHGQLSSRRMLATPETANLLRAARKHFDSYRQAIEQAGIDYEQIPDRHNHWSEPLIVQTIQQAHARDADLSYAGMDKELKLRRAAEAHFGSWRRAVEAAGIDYDKVKKPAERRWTREVILEELRKIYESGKEVRNVYRDHSTLYVAAQNHFGGYAAALAAAGIEPPPRQKTWPPEKILQTLRELSRTKVDMSSKRFSDLHGSLFSAAKREFGSYHEAMTRAGIDYRKVSMQIQWTPKMVIEGLRKALRGKKEYTITQFNRDNARLYSAAIRLFGSFAKALQAARLPYPVGRGPAAAGHWNESTILKELRELDKAGEDLRDRTAKTRYLSLYWAARKHFGTYINAVAQAGIDYDRMVQRALRKQRQSDSRL